MGNHASWWLFFGGSCTVGAVTGIAVLDATAAGVVLAGLLAVACGLLWWLGEARFRDRDSTEARPHRTTRNGRPRMSTRRVA